MKKILSILVVMLAMVNVNAFADDTYGLTTIVENGSVELTVDDEAVTEAAAGVTVKVTVTPNAAYSTTGVTAIAYTDWGSAKMPKKTPVVIKDIEVTKVSDNVYTFTMPEAKVQVTATTAETPVTSWTVAGTTDADSGEDILFGTAWSADLAANDMVLNSETGLYEWKKEGISLESGKTIQYKVVGNHSWDINYGANGNFDGANIEYAISETAEYDIVISFDATSHVSNIGVTKVDAVIDDYVVAGSKEALNAVVGGNEGGWDATATENKMTTTDGKTYTLVVENAILKKGVTYLCKVVKQGDPLVWLPYSNVEFTTGDAERGYFTVTYTWKTPASTGTDEGILTVATERTGDAPEEPVEETTWTVAGDESIFGSNWDTTDTNNDMVLNEGTGLYEWEKESLTLSEGTYALKVVKNHSWNNENYGKPDSNDDYEITIAENGIYTVKITFNESTHAIGHVATKTGDVVITDTYVVAGDAAIVNGEEAWNTTSEANNMTTDDDEKYTLTVSNIDLQPGTYEYKIVKNGSQWIPDGMGNNKTIVIEEYGIYNVTYTYKVTGDEISAEVTQVAKLFAETIPAAKYITCFYADDLKLRVADADVKFYMATSVTDAQVNITEVTTKEIPAETPFLIYNAAVADKNITLIDDGTAVTPINLVTADQFKGTAVAKEFEVSETLDYFVCDGDNFVFVKDAGTLPAHRCWIELSKNAAAKSLAIVIDGETDGIRSAQSAQQNNGIRYNLAGQRVGNDYKGIVIINGKKVMK